MTLLLSRPSETPAQAQASFGPFGNQIGSHRKSSAALDNRLAAASLSQTPLPDKCDLANLLYGFTIAYQLRDLCWEKQWMVWQRLETLPRFPFLVAHGAGWGEGGGWNGRYGSSGWKTHNSLLVLWSISWQIGGHYHSIRGYCDGRWAIELKFSVGNLLAASYFKCLVKKKFGIGLVLKICRLIEKVSRPLRYIKDFLLNVEKEDF